MRQLKISKSIMNRGDVSFTLYLHEISKIELISPEEEVKLAKRIKKGDQAALGKLVNTNLRFVVSVAKQYQGRGTSLSDLVNEGNLGLIKAAQRFDHTKGFKFISYAVWWIRQSIMQALSEQARIVRLPMNRIGALGKLNKEFAKLEQEYGRNPTGQELAEAMELPDWKVDVLFKTSGYSVSVDAPLLNQDDKTLLDVLPGREETSTDKGILQDSLREEIERSLNTLDEREAAILRMYFGIDFQYNMTLEEVAKEVGITRERVKQLKERAIKKLRKNGRSKLLREYLV